MIRMEQLVSIVSRSPLGMPFSVIRDEMKCSNVELEGLLVGAVQKKRIERSGNGLFRLPLKADIDHSYLFNVEDENAAELEEQELLITPKRCTRCNETKDALGDFYQTGKKGDPCKKCRSDLNRVSEARRKQQRKARASTKEAMYMILELMRHVCIEGDEVIISITGPTGKQRVAKVRSGAKGKAFSPVAAFVLSATRTT